MVIISNCAVYQLGQSLPCILFFFTLKTMQGNNLWHVYTEGPNKITQMCFTKNKPEG